MMSSRRGLGRSGPGGREILYFHVVDAMLKVSKCPDFVVNRGHYFCSDYFKEEPGLSDEDKLALIEFLKTM
ncbi:MAG: hypothetical protein ACREYF_15465 [Gammaproteobacteria bacterium]